MSDVERNPSAHSLQGEVADVAVLQMLGGAIFESPGGLTLPSGVRLSATEAQAFTGAFANDAPQGLPHESGGKSPDTPHQAQAETNTNLNPSSSSHDTWTGEP